jgi:hypothetical protein
VPAELGAKLLKLIAVVQPEKRLACLPVEGKPRAGISSVVDDLDGAHGRYGFTNCPANPKIGLYRITINISERISTGYPQVPHEFRCSVLLSGVVADSAPARTRPRRERTISRQGALRA